MSPSADAGLPVRALADQAVAAALDADWTRAADLNQKILEAAPDDIDAHNRLGRAYVEQGKVEEAKASFAEVLKAEPYNSIAIRGVQRTTQLLDHKAKAVTTKTKTSPASSSRTWARPASSGSSIPPRATSSPATPSALSASSASKRASWRSTPATASSSDSSSRRSGGGSST